MLTTDKKIDQRIELIWKRLLSQGHKCSKADVIRKMIGLKKQGKKTHKGWLKLTPDEIWREFR